MNNYIKLHDNILALNLPMEERVVLALIAQMTVNGSGFWAGYKAMSERLHIPKSRCRKFTEHLAEEGLVEINREKIGENTRLVFRTKNTKTLARAVAD